MTPALEDIKALVYSLAEKINAPQHLLPTYGRTVDSGHPHIEIDNNGQLYYVVVERGQELRRDFAVDINDLLFRVFEGVTFSMACDFELRNRIKNQDFRRQLFSQQLELLGILDKKWEIQQQRYHQQILAHSPFDDK
jgi:hypothetical protein